MKSNPNLTTRAVSEEDEGHIPNLLPQPLPPDEALRLADLARVPPEEHELFFELIDMTIALVWMRDRRALGTRIGPALDGVAKAARVLQQRFGQLDPINRRWVERLWRRTYLYNNWLPDVPETVFRLSHLFSSAAGMSPPRSTSEARPRHQKSNRQRTRKDVIFRDFVRRLRSIAGECGGKLSLDHEHEGGSLLDAISILSPHLPKGVVPKKVSPKALKKIIATKSFNAPSAEIDFFSPEPFA